MIKKETACKVQKRAFQTNNKKHMKTLRWKKLGMFEGLRSGNVRGPLALKEGTVLIKVVYIRTK